MYGEPENENQDFTDENVVYLSNDNDAEYINDPMVSSGVDQDLPQTLPEYPAVPYNEPVSAALENEMVYLQDEYAPAPTQSVGVAQDIIELSKNIASGDEKIATAALETFSQSTLAKFTSPKVVGPILLFWAYRGKLSYAERLVIGLVGAGAVVSGFSGAKKATQVGIKTIQAGVQHPMLKAKIQEYSNPLAGRY